MAAVKSEPVKEDIPGHPFYHPFHCHTWSVGKHTFHIGYARGYNAGGLIGTEHNGIFILSLSLKRVVLDKWMGQEGCYYEDRNHTAEVIEEIDRILALDEKGMDEFLNITPRVRFNPYADRIAKQKSAKKDLKIRSQFNLTDFKDAKFMSAKDKLRTVRQTEMFIRDRIFAGPDYAATQFQKSTYHMLSMYYGHIAHNNRDGFYGAQMRNRMDFLHNLRLMADRRSTWGFLPGSDDKGDLYDAITKVARAYLQFTDKVR